MNQNPNPGKMIWDVNQLTNHGRNKIRRREKF